MLINDWPRRLCMWACLALYFLSLRSATQLRAETLTDEGEHLRRLQYLLMWSGDYFGQLDGKAGPLTIHSVRSFQDKTGFRRTGVMDATQLRKLGADAQTVMREAGYEPVYDKVMGGYVVLPTHIVRKQSTMQEVGFYSAGEPMILEVETSQRPIGQASLLDLYRTLLNPLDNEAVLENIFRGDYFRVTWQTRELIRFVQYVERDSVIKVLEVRMQRGAESKQWMLAKAMLYDFAPFDKPTAIGPLPEMRVLLAALNSSAREMRSGGSGSGFIVSHLGHVLTNAHVVLSCDTIRVGRLRDGHLIALDSRGDLALLQVSQSKNDKVARFASTSIALGEDVVVFGYPLRPILGDYLNMSTGIVSSLAGFGGDPRYIQISAVVRPGNSGGPVIDLKGRVVGVATSILNMSKAGRQREVVQPVTFVIRRESIVRFLREQGLEPEMSSLDEVRPKTIIASEADGYTVPISCDAP
jgi:S1-C subfamily serine protease